MKRLLSIILAILMIATSIPLVALPTFAEEGTTNKKITDYSVGDTFEFGYYPQSEVINSTLISALNSQSGSWVSYNYYINNSQSDFMKYKDVVYNGEKYRAVTFSSYRPYYTTISSSTDNTFQDDNGYCIGNTYWFKYEPLTWKVLDPSTGLVMCTSIIDSQDYYYTTSNRTIDGKTIYANNWEYSTIRTWLNDTFYNTAFTTDQQSAIATTTIQNPAYSTSYSQYNANATSDKIYLLSYTDVQNTSYGFSSGTSSSTTRQFKGTDYAKAQGLYVNSSNKCSYYRLRTAGYGNDYACYVCYDGSVDDIYFVNDASDGILPAFNFNLNSEIFQSKNCFLGNHEMVSHDGQAPTCTEDGWKDYEVCSVCGYSTYEVITALGHIWNEGEVTTDPTCLNTGIKTFICTVCSVKKTEDIPALGHNYIKTEIDSHHTAQGVYNAKCSRCGVINGTVKGEFKKITDYSKGDTFEFGYYPQSKVTDSSLISSLNSQSGSWVSYNYYISSSQSDFMKYKDVVYNGEKYRAVTFSSYRPYYTSYTSSTSNSYQDDNAYTTGNTYWFKYEPLTWKVLDPSTGLVMCTSIIDSQDYYYTDSNRTIDGKTVYANNWEYSTIRTWLNDTFYNTAFTTEQQSAIATTTIQNPAYSTSYSAYNANATSDKIYLLSYTDVQNTSYGFSSGTSSSTTRLFKGTDYAKAQGLYVNSSNKCSYYRLRTAGYSSFYACIVSNDGTVYDYISVNYTYDGILPAFNFNLNSEIFQSKIHKSEVIYEFDSIVYPSATQKGGTKYICDVCDAIYISDQIKSTTNDLTYNFNTETGKLMISGEGALADCTATTTPWEKFKTSIKEVEIQDGVTSIGANAFNGCTNLETISIADSVTSIGDSAFKYCSKLKTITLGYAVEIIGSYAFYGCSSLESVAIPDTVNTIGASAFAGCSSLQSITFPSSVTTIDSKAFENCTSFTTVTVPETVTSIGASAFSGCSNLEEITLPFIGGTVEDTNTFSYVFETVPAKLEKVTVLAGSVVDNAFKNCLNIKKIIVTSDIVEVGTSAFNGCTNLETITIPDSVTSIGAYAFENTKFYNDQSNWDSGILTIGNNLIKVDTSVLGSLTVNSDIRLIADEAAIDCTELTRVIIPSNVQYIGKNAFKNCTGIRTLTLRTSAETIEDGAFENCSSITTVTIPNTVKTISANVFKNCTSLATVTVGSSVETIGASAFNGCSSLEGFTIPSTVKTIGASAFAGCINLQSITFPESVTTIGSKAFENCTSFTKVTVPETVTSIGASAFSGCSNLEEITLPFIGGTVEDTNTFSYVFGTVPAKLEKVTILSGAVVDNAFKNCSNIKQITVPSDIEAVGASAFNGCTSLVGFTIPSTVKTIGASAFAGCSNLQSITFPSSVTTIGSKAFENCTIFTTVTVPVTVTSIGASAFSGCSNLAEITLPFIGGTIEDTNTFSYAFGSVHAKLEKVTILAGAVVDNAFKNCSNIKQITVPCDIEAIGASAFNGCTSLESSTIPDTVKTIGASAFTDCSNLQSITFPASVTTIGSRAFEDCTSFTTVTVPETVTSIGASAFSGCSNLEEITLPFIGGTVEDTNTFSYVFGTVPAKLEKVTILTGAVVDNAFKNCSNIKEITVPSDIVEIGASAFNGCSSLDNFIIPSSVSIIGVSAFEGCTSLSGIVLPNSVTVIDNYVFKNCTGLTSFVASSSIETIKPKAFEGCSNITKFACLNRDIDVYEVASDLTDGSTIYAYDNDFGNKETTEIEGLNFVELSTYNCENNNHEFTFYAEEITLSPTCTEKGSKNKTCLICGNVINEEIAIDSTAHDYVQTEIDSYHTSADIYAYVCSRCNAVKPIETEQVVDSNTTKEIRTTFPSSGYPESEHNYSNSYSNTWTYNAPRTCSKVEITFSSSTRTESGYDYIYIYTLDGIQVGRYDGTSLAGKTISVDGSGFKIKLTSDSSNTYYGFSFTSIVGIVQETVPAYKTVYKSHPISSGFEYNSSVKASATCTAKGTTTYTCEICGVNYDEQDIDIVDHTPSEPEEENRVNATCRTEGSYDEVVYCSVCDAELSREAKTIEMVAHSYDDETTEPTCTTAGYTTYICSECGDRYVDNNVDALGHIGGIADCVDKAICTRCSQPYGDVDSTNHKSVVIDPVVNPTCTETGLTEGSHCTSCNSVVIARNVILALDHDWDEGVIEAKPDCTNAGVKKYVCKRDSSHTKTEALSANGHTIVIDSAKPSTCTETGLTEGKHCSVCEAIIVKQESTTVLGHDYKTVENSAKAATCTENGKEADKKCSRCNDVITGATILAKGHTSDTGTVTKKSTCTATGSKTYKCTTCGEVLKTETIAKIAHKNVTIKAVAATCTKDGKTAGAKCSVCGTITKKQTTVKATGHTPVTLKAVTATAKKSGLTAGSKCSVCGTILKAQTMTLAQVSSLKASKQTTSGLTLTWSKINGAKYYKVEQSTDGKKWTTVKTVTTNTLAITKLKAGTTYQYRVTALDSTKKIAGKASAVLKATTLCAAPTVTLKAQILKRVQVSWGAVTGAKSYIIYKSTDGKKWTKVTTTTKTSYTLTKLTAGKKIYVKVVAVNADKANSAYSKTASVTVKK